VLEVICAQVWHMASQAYSQAYTEGSSLSSGGTKCLQYRGYTAAKKLREAQKK